MDTGTHIVMGVALGGLAYIQPSVATNPELAYATMLATIIGSNAPDFDAIAKLKGSSSYLKHHRGMSHSWPAILIWSFIISFSLNTFFSLQAMSTLFLWSAIAVTIHVLVDLFNSYGTQVLLPHSKRWIALNVIHIFDPTIFVLLLGGIIWWALFANPVFIFSIIFMLILSYYIWRIVVHARVEKKIATSYPNAQIFALPTLFWSTWHVIIKFDTRYEVGTYKKDKLVIKDSFIIREFNDVVQTASNDPKLKVFLEISPYYYWDEKRTNYGYEIRFIDLRYIINDNYSFLAIVQLNHQQEIIKSFVGRVFNEDHLSKRLSLKSS